MYFHFSPVHNKRDQESVFNRAATQAFDCLLQEPNTKLEMLMHFETLKQQVLEMAEFSGRFVPGEISGNQNYLAELRAIETRVMGTHTPDGEFQSVQFLMLAIFHYRLGNLRKAKELTLLARGEYLRCGAESELGFHDLLLAIFSGELHEWQEAEDRCILALHETSFHENPETTAQIWQIYGRVLSKLGRVEESTAAFLMAKTIYKNSAAWKKLVQVCLNLATVSISTKDWHGSIQYLKEALLITYNHSLVQMEMEILYALQQIYQYLGHVTEAEGCKQRVRWLMTDFR